MQAPGGSEEPGPGPILQMQAVRFRYPGARGDVLDLDALALAPAERLLLRGDSGCGKSTLLALAAGVLLAGTGNVRLLGRDWRELSAGGAQWHNAVLEWQFRRAGLEPPGETAGTAVTHMFGPGGEHGVSLPDPPTVKADMVALGHRLRSLAAEAGVEMFERCKAVRVELDGVRPVALRTEATPVSGT